MKYRSIRLYCIACCLRLDRSLLGDQMGNVLESIEQEPERVFTGDEKGEIRGPLFELQANISLNSYAWPEVEVWRAKARYEACMAVWKSLADEGDEQERKKPLYFWDLSTSSAMEKVSLHAASAAEYHAMACGGSGADAKAETLEHHRLLRDCIPCALGNEQDGDRSWLTPIVRALAQKIVLDSAFDLLPILADAMEEGGCTSTDLLLHARCQVPHFKGCRVLEMALGRI